MLLGVDGPSAASSSLVGVMLPSREGGLLVSSPPPAVGENDSSFIKHNAQLSVYKQEILLSWSPCTIEVTSWDQHNDSSPIMYDMPKLSWDYVLEQVMHH